MLTQGMQDITHPPIRQCVPNPGEPPHCLSPGRHQVSSLPTPYYPATRKQELYIRDGHWYSTEVSTKKVVGSMTPDTIIYHVCC